MRFTFFKAPYNRKFYRDPIYYDEAKEERLERERRIREEMGLSTDDIVDESSLTYKDRIKGSMRSKFQGRYDSQKSGNRASNFRFIIILVALFLLAYYILNANFAWLNKFLQM